MFIKLILFFLQISYVYSSCEAYWLSNISSEYASSIGLSEPGNAISSLSYTIFGFAGLLTTNNSIFYHFIMNLFIILGLFSFLHHYYYYNAKWAYSGDIVSMVVLAPMSLLYIACNNICKYIFINKIFNFIITLIFLVMLIFYELSLDWKPFYKVITHFY